MQEFNWGTIFKFTVLCVLFLAVVLVGGYTAKWMDADLEFRKAQAEEQLGYAEFEVLLGSNVGESIPGVLKIAEEDIPKFFDAHTWRLLPPPEEEVVE